MPDVPTILVVDDEPEIRALLRDGLQAEGYRVIVAGNEVALKEAIADQSVRLITLDLNLGGRDGLDLVREIRALRNLPIVMITGRGAPTERAAGLEFGADDYITKPFHMLEVVLRLRKLLALYEPALGQQPNSAARKFTFDRFVLDPIARELRSTNGTPVELTETELQLLELFVRNPARVLSRDEIWRSVRGQDWSPLDRTLDGHVARLRQKIELPEDEVPRMIKSVRGVGYVFTTDVRCV